MKTLHKLKHLELNSTLQQARVELWVEHRDGEGFASFKIELVAKENEYFTSWESIDSRLRDYLVIPDSIHVHGVELVNHSSIPLNFGFNLYCE